MSKFKNAFSEEVWNSTYRFGQELTIDDTFIRIAKALGAVETDSEFWTQKFLSILTDFKFVPGGRIVSNAGTNIGGTSLINCFIPGTKVLTDTGYKPIETIKTGEFVLSHTGNWRRVVNTMNRHFEGDLDVYQSSLLSEDIEVTPEHPFYQGDNEWENSESNQKLVLLKRVEGAKVLISVADYLTNDLKLNLERSDDLIYLKTINKKNKSVKKHSFCKNQLILTPELAYAFGRFVGDGSTFSVNKKSTDGFNLIFSKKEINELNFIKNTLEHNFGIQININKSNQFDGIYLRKNNIIVSTFLRNAFGENSYSKRIPKFIWIAEAAIIESFLLGIFDADGCISKRGEAKLVLNNESLIKDIQALMHIIGYHTRVTKVKVKGSSAWKLGLTKSQGNAFITSMRKYYVDDRILKELKIPKKKHSVKQQFGTFDNWSEINHFEKSNKFYSGPVYNISVDIDESYVVNNVIVHNCFVDNMLGHDADSMESIMDALKRQALILKSEGGYGTSFNVLRPKGAYVSGIANETPGSVAMMELWDKSSEIITMGSGKISDKTDAKKKIRKGAMLGELDVWHPDIEEFIVAKQTPGRLSKFNLSVGITNDFMDAVLNHKPWNLIYPDYELEKQNYKQHWKGDIKDWIARGYPVKIYKTFEDANILWNLITQSTYNRNEPGILFVDRINERNNLWYCEHIFGTNPCLTGETLVAVADGRNAVSIETLAKTNESFPVYSGKIKGNNHKGWKTEIKSAKAFSTGFKPVIKLNLSDGSSFKCTEDHRLALDDNSYVEAKDSIDKELSKFFTFSNKNSKKSYRHINSISNGHTRQYKMIYEFNNDIYDGLNFNVNHIDGNSINDHIDNLELLNLKDHKAITDRKGLNNPINKISSEYRNLLNKRKNIQSQAKQNHWTTEKLKLQLDEFDNEYGELINSFKKNENVILNEPIKVTSIEFVGIEEVYDLTVQDNHNFYIITKTDDDNYLNCSGLLVHNCGEQPLPDKGICLLGNINLTQYVIGNDYDWNALGKDIPIIIRFMDNVNEIANVPLKEQEQSLKDKRRIGLGVMGYASSLLMMGYRYGSPEALQITERLVNFIANRAYLASSQLAGEKGSFLLFDREKYLQSKHLEVLDFEVLQSIERYGMRNSHVLSIAPTGNTSAFANNVSGGLEPLFSTSYYRTYIIPTPPEGLALPEKIDWNNRTAELNGWSWINEGDDNLLTTTFNDVVYKYDKNRGLTKVALVEDYGYSLLTPEQKNKDYVVTTFDLKIEDHINTMVIFAKYMDAAVSKTINVPSDYSFEDFQKVYIDAYNSGYIKGCTTYREGTMMSVLSKTIQSTTAKNDASKRPKKLPCDIHHLVVKGHPWVVLIGMLNETPYEVFAFKKKNIKLSSDITHGHLVKIKSGHYDLDLGFVTLENVTELFTQDEEEALTRMISMAMRHNVDLRYIIEQLNKSEGTIVSFSKAISRTLKKYLMDDTNVGDCPECGGKLIKTESCVKCTSCDYSAC